MRLDLYQAESERIANEQISLLDEAKQRIASGEPLSRLERRGKITQQELTQWNATIGLRNRFVHDYMNVDIHIVYELITSNRHQFIGEFLRKPLPTTL